MLTCTCSASTSKASSASEGPVAGGSSQDGDPADKKGTGSATWDGMVDEWSKTLVNYHAQGREMMDEAASRNKYALESALAASSAYVSAMTDLVVRPL